MDRLSHGDTVVFRALQPDGRIGAVQCGRAISDDDRGLLAWVGVGSAVMRRTLLDGSPIRPLPLSEKLRVPTLLAPSAWRDYGVLILTPPAADHAVWWFFDQDHIFRGWYVNLQSRTTRWFGGVDLLDQALDVVIDADLGWRWKDEDEFAERTGHALFWDDDGASRIRGEGERLIALAQARAFPFDGSWCDFRPDPGWGPTELPWWWDQNPGQASPTIIR